MTGCDFGDVVLVQFPFTNQVGSKQRPAVVISTAEYQRQRPDVILLAVTSQVRPHRGFGEALVQDWQAAGLLKPSVFKPLVFTTETKLLRRTLGKLAPADQQNLRSVLQTIIG
ncbi:MAG: type II toxin-antitoxin system PemK/MazF family toxin [Pseudoxanthomonas sp.]